jgi:hypothetical protein
VCPVQSLSPASSMWSGLLFQSNRRLLSGHSNAAWAIATRLSTHASIHPGDKYKFAAARSGKKGGGHFSDFFLPTKMLLSIYTRAQQHTGAKGRFLRLLCFYLRDPQPKCELTSLSLVVTQKRDRDCTLPSQQKPVATAAAVAAATKIKLGKTTSQGPRKVKFFEAASFNLFIVFAL